MKKVFAILSAFALTIALVGLNVNSKVAADELWTVDPTLSENEIPMYIMDSIYSTFPNYYDNAAKADPNWESVARMYPWNETRLQVKQINSEGEYTGKEYAIYFAGALSAGELGTGNNLLFFKLDDNGKVVLARMNGGKWSGSVAMDPSLSHVRKNVTGQTITFDALQLWSEAGSTNGGNLYNRVLVFDGNGRAIRGMGINQGYYAEDNPEAVNPVAPEYCYVNGVVTKAEAGVVCDKVMEPKLDEDGNPAMDADGNPIMVETEKDNYLYSRFVWEWVSKADFEAEGFVGVNTVPYLSEGWDAMKWDYATYEEASEGYMCVAFLGSESSDVKLTAEQLAVYTATCEANSLPAPSASTRRACAVQITVPDGGMVYDFGYLDKGKPALQEKFMDMFKGAYYYGRKLDKDGKGMAYQKTFDFSAKPLYATDKVVNGYSYQLLEGQNTVEVMQGQVVYPAKNIVYTGLSNYWSVPNDVTSFKADASVVDLTIVVNGVTVVAPKTGYLTFDDMVEDFMADWNTYAEEKGLNKLTVKPNVNQTDAEIVDQFYNVLGWDLAGTSANAEAFSAKYWTKWGWMFEYIVTKCKEAGVAAVNWTGNGGVSSPGSSRDALWGFLAQSPKRSIAGTYANTCTDFSEGKAQEWLDPRTNLDMWNEYCINTAEAGIDTNYVVEFKAKNNVTGIESSYTIRYVVVDEYTPILKVNKSACILVPKKNGDKIEIPTLNEYTLCTAYNARYNGSTILGDDISYKVHYTSETLDFENPTEGEHEVVARVYSASGAKYAEKKFTVSIEDMTAPRVDGQDLVLAYGSYFTPSMVVTFAYDAVDGNLMNNDFKGWITVVSKTAVNTSKPGKYTVELEISDRSGNATKLSKQVVVLEPTSLKELSEKADQLLGLAATKSELDDLSDKVDGLAAQITAIQDTLAAQAAKKCGSKATVLVEFLAATSLLGLVLRKRH